MTAALCVLSDRYNTVDVCVAVAIDAGLITPIVFGADRKVAVFSFVIFAHVHIALDIIIGSKYVSATALLMTCLWY